MVRITPFLSIKTPLPEIGLNKPPVLVVQIILTIDVLTFSLSSLKFMGSIVSVGGVTIETADLSVGNKKVGFFLSEIIFCVVVETDFSSIIEVVATEGEMFSVKFSGEGVVTEKILIISPKKAANTDLKKSIRFMPLILTEALIKVV